MSVDQVILQKARTAYAELFESRPVLLDRVSRDIEQNSYDSSAHREFLAETLLYLFREADAEPSGPQN